MHLAGATPQVSMGETSPAGRELTAAILVVDDEPAIVRALASLLRRRGYEVDTAAHGRLALKKLQIRAYDLLLRDLRRPACEGPALYHDLQHRRPPLCQRIIFLTGDTLCCAWRCPQGSAADRPMATGYATISR